MGCADRGITSAIRAHATTVLAAEECVSTDADPTGNGILLVGGLLGYGVGFQKLRSWVASRGS
jgi:hypothetical protein